MRDDVLTPLWVASTFTSAEFSEQCCARWCKQGRLVEGACHHHRLFAHFLPDCSVRIIRTPTHQLLGKSTENNQNKSTPRTPTWFWFWFDTAQDFVFVEDEFVMLCLSDHLWCFVAKLNLLRFSPFPSYIFRDQIGDFVFLVLYFLSLLTFAIVARYFMSPWNGWRWTGPHTFDYPPSPVTISSLATRHLKSNIFQIYKAKLLSPPKQSQNFVVDSATGQDWRDPCRCVQKLMWRSFSQIEEIMGMMISLLPTM